ncbi:MAG: DUF2937 family protein [Gammaproteobacteria bacterium]|nr:DUF2937 family protein [Gammaproteobacteria bacterium]
MKVGHLLRGYLRLVTFGAGLLLGIQVPSYMDQYQKRVDAHFLEISNNISGFQATANLLFNGNMEELISYYENSNDRVFEEDSVSIRNIYNRYNLIVAEQGALSAPWYTSALHIVFSANPEIRGEVFQAYSYTVPLDLRALEWGFGAAIFVTLVLESAGLVCLRSIFFMRPRKRRVV